MKKILSSKKALYCIAAGVTILILISWLYMAVIIPFQSADNLLLGTNRGTGSYRLMDNGFDASAEKAGAGVKVTTMARDAKGWLVLFYDDGHSRTLLSGPEGDSYTLAFEAKSNTTEAEIRASHRQGDGQQNQIDFGTAKISVADTWERFTLTGTLRGVEATTQGIYLNLKNNIPGTEITIRNLTLTKAGSE